MQETQEKRVRSLGQEDPLEEETATHSQYSCLGNRCNRGSWWATVHGVTKSQTWLSSHTPTHGTSIICMENSLKIKFQGLPWRSTDKTLSCKARDTSLTPRLGRSHMPWSNEARVCSRAWKLWLLQALGSATRGTTTVSSLHATTRESTHTATKTHHSQKKKNSKQCR